MFLRTFYVTVMSMDYVSDENLTDEEEIMNLESPGPSKIKRARKEIINHRLSAALDKCKISDRDAVHLSKYLQLQVNRLMSILVST